MTNDYRDLDLPTVQIIHAVEPYTMTSAERIFALCNSVRYVVRHHIPGAIVECGVWRGGSAMAAMRVLLELQVIDREIFLFDTFSGMTQPTSRDEDINGASARELMESAPGREALINAYASLQEVRTNIAAVGYPMERVHFVEGPVEVTIPAASPDAIALLRLDTDWYESTRHELIHLGKRVSHLGVLIVDDYGHWHGARQAVDEFFATFERPVLLNRIDYTGRIAILP